MTTRLHDLAETGTLLGGVCARTVRRLIEAGELEYCDIAPPGASRAILRVSDEQIARFIKARSRKAKRTRVA